MAVLSLHYLVIYEHYISSFISTTHNPYFQIQYSISKDIAKVYLKTLSLRSSPKIVTYDYPIMLGSQLRIVNEYDIKLVRDCGRLPIFPCSSTIKTIFNDFLNEHTDGGDQWEIFIDRTTSSFELAFYKDLIFEKEKPFLSCIVRKDEDVCSVVGLTYLVRYLCDTNEKFQEQGDNISNLRWYTCINELAFYLEKSVNKFYNAAKYYIDKF